MTHTAAQRGISTWVQSYILAETAAYTVRLGIHNNATNFKKHAALPNICQRGQNFKLISENSMHFFKKNNLLLGMV